MKTSSVAIACALALSSAATAQTTTSAPIAPSAVTPIAPPSNGTAVLRVGTKVPLKLAETLTTKGKQLRVGQRFQLEVAETIFVDGQPVIPVGSPGVGEITDVRNKGMWGRSGHLGARILYVTVNGRQIRMSGAFDDKGTAGGIGAVATSAIVFAPAGFFMTGTSAKVPLGAPVTGFVDEDVPLNFASGGSAPLTIGAPASQSTVVAPTPIPVSASVAH